MSNNLFKEIYADITLESWKSAIAGGLLGASSLLGAEPTNKPPPTPVPITNAQFLEKNKTNINILARTIWAEAKKEGDTGMRAVASVIYNRGNGNVPNMIREIKKPNQFSCWNSMNWNNFTLKTKSGKAWENAEKIANELVSYKFSPTTTANHYYNPSLCTPSWSHIKGKIRPHTKIGSHIFMEIK